MKKLVVLNSLLSGILVIIYGWEVLLVLQNQAPYYPFASHEGVWYMASPELYRNFCLLFGGLFLLSLAGGIMAYRRRSKPRLLVFFIATIILQVLVLIG
jgi:hypothetical protein